VQYEHHDNLPSLLCCSRRIIHSKGLCPSCCHCGATWPSTRSSCFVLCEHALQAEHAHLLDGTNMISSSEEHEQVSTFLLVHCLVDLLQQPQEWRGIDADVPAAPSAALMRSALVYVGGRATLGSFALQLFRWHVLHLQASSACRCWIPSAPMLFSVSLVPLCNISTRLLMPLQGSSACHGHPAPGLDAGGRALAARACLQSSRTALRG
jgi:hypothetical protein